MDDNTEMKTAALFQLLDVIKDMNECIEASKEMNSPSMVRQYEFLKRRFTKQLLELLADYQLPLRLIENE